MELELANVPQQHLDFLSCDISHPVVRLMAPRCLQDTFVYG